MNWLAVFVGGGLGSILRYAIGVYFKNENQSFPWPTFMANLISCFIAGLVLTMIAKNILPSSAKTLLISGFCGGFSTFSALSIESVTLWQDGNYTIFGLYLLASIIAGILMVIAGGAIVQS